MKGFSTIELLVVVAITAVIGTFFVNAALHHAPLGYAYPDTATSTITSDVFDVDSAAIESCDVLGEVYAIGSHSDCQKLLNAAMKKRKSHQTWCDAHTAKDLTLTEWQDCQDI